MDTSRTTYYVSENRPGSEVSAEIAAALASSSIAFRKIDDQYSNVLLARAKQVYIYSIA
jgi:endoglucanase